MFDLSDCTNIQAFNSLFAQLANQPNMICWIKSYDNARQLYLSPQFETIFGGSCDSLYQDPKSWWNYLLPNDVEKVKPIIQSRALKAENKENNDVILFRINSIGNTIRYLRDTSFHIYNEYKKPIAIAGIGEEISAEHWYKVANKQANEVVDYPGSMNVLDILQNENLTLFHNKPGRKSIYVSELRVNGVRAHLTKKEATVLEHLREGKTAKQTGALINLSPRTVETHLESIKNKTGCRTKLELLTKITEAFN